MKSDKRPQDRHGENAVKALLLEALITGKIISHTETECSRLELTGGDVNGTELQL